MDSRAPCCGYPEQGIRCPDGVLRSATGLQAARAAPQPLGDDSASPALTSAACGQPAASTVDRSQRLRLVQQIAAVQVAQQRLGQLRGLAAGRRAGRCSASVTGFPPASNRQVQRLAHAQGAAPSAPAEHHLPRQQRLQRRRPPAAPPGPGRAPPPAPGSCQVKLRARKSVAAIMRPAVGRARPFHAPQRGVDVGARGAAPAPARRRRAGPGSGPGRPPGAASARRCRCARCGRRPACARRSGRAQRTSAATAPVMRPATAGSRVFSTARRWASSRSRTGSSSLGTHHTSAARAVAVGGAGGSGSSASRARGG